MDRSICTRERYWDMFVNSIRPLLLPKSPMVTGRRRSRPHGQRNHRAPPSLRLKDLLSNNRTSFSVDIADVGHTTVMQHSIPIDIQARLTLKQPLRRISHFLRPVVDEQLQTVLKADVIQPSTNPWSSPIVLVRKRTAVTALASTTGNVMA